MLIRSFQPSDEPAVIALWQACDLVRPWNNPQLDIRRKLAVQPAMFLVAEADQRVMGTVMAGYEGHRGWINYLAVSPTERLQGVGRQLMQAAESALKAAGCPKINLQVRDGNDAVLAFYERLGYGVDPVVSLGKRLVADDSRTTDV
ncbi:MAG: GNAT family acetyltransferase [Pseudomonadota bacterium]|nr:GNAT family acetyltransferase [Pseudomonadota bacterium]